MASLLMLSVSIRAVISAWLRGVPDISPTTRLCGLSCQIDVWPYIRYFFHMKTTLNIDDQVMARLKQEAARQGRTMSELVETALRMLLRSRKRKEELPPLPSFRSGGARVDIADREALYQAMEGR